MAGPYYVDVTTGDDGDSGLSEELAFATLAHAIDMVAAGEKVWVKASGDYETEDGANDCVMFIDAGQVGASETPIVFEGYHTTPGDGGIVTINADPVGDQFSYCVYSTQSSIHILFKNFVFTGASNDSFKGTVGNYLYFYNCRFTNAADNACQPYNLCIFFNCMFDNSARGVSVNTSALFIGCVAHSNSEQGFYCGGSDVIYNCLAFDNGTAHADFRGNQRDVYINCIADGENEAGVTGIINNGANGYAFHVLNSILYDCGVGMDSSSDINENITGFFNLFCSNTDDCSASFTDVSAGDGVGDRGDVASAQAEAALFTDAGNVTNLHRDYSPKDADSDSVGAGMDASFCMTFWHSWDPAHDNTNPPAV